MVLAARTLPICLRVVYESVNHPLWSGSVLVGPPQLREVDGVAHSPLHVDKDRNQDTGWCPHGVNLDLHTLLVHLALHQLRPLQLNHGIQPAFFQLEGLRIKKLHEVPVAVLKPPSVLESPAVLGNTHFCGLKQPRACRVGHVFTEASGDSSNSRPSVRFKLV